MLEDRWYIKAIGTGHTVLTVGTIDISETHLAAGYVTKKSKLLVTEPP
jgi:hypothetical protein